MASSLLVLLDDIATILDDVAVMTKVAAKKTAGVLGDDLALNAQQVSGVKPDRELPVVWAVAKGSVINKVILVIAALAINAFIPWAVTPLLMLGGAFLCFEGVEKLAHKYLHKADHEQHYKQHLQANVNPEIDISAVEKDKIKGAIRTDFILSAEIIVISLGTVKEAAFGSQLTVLIGISAIMTVGVYGLVAGIVKLDDGGLYLTKKAGETSSARMQRSFGRGILVFAPFLMKTLSIVGTAAMFMVGGGILTHGIPGAEPISHSLAGSVHGIPGMGFVVSTLFDVLVGVIVGLIALGLVTAGQKIFKKNKAAA